MADWFSIPNTSVDPDAPVTSNLMYALRDNPIAIAEGAAGAPRIFDIALGGAITANGIDWVARRYSRIGWNSISQYVLAGVAGSGAVETGQVVDGSSLALRRLDGSELAGGLPGRYMLHSANISSSSGPAPTDRGGLWRRVE